MKMKCIYIVSKYTKHTMKTFKTNLLGVALAGLILGACSQTGMYETADLMNEQAEAAKSGFRLDPFGMGNENAMTLAGGGNWETDCITDLTGSAFKASGSLSGTWGNQNNPNEKTLNVEVWNTLTTIEYRFTLISDDMQNGGNLQYFNESTSTWVNQGALTLGSAFSVSRPLPSGWKAGDEILEQWRNSGGGGNPLEVGDVAYKLIGICTTTTLTSDVSLSVPLCEGTAVTLTASVSSFGTFTGGTIEIRGPGNTVVASQAVTAGDKDVTYSVPTGSEGSYTYTAYYVGAGSNGYNNSASAAVTVNVTECGGCDESFSYVQNQDGSYTFTYQSEVDLDNAEFKFTSPHVAEITSEDGKIYTVNPGNGQGSPTVSTWVGDITACTPITFTLSFTPDCDQNQGGFANIWTDFKVNGDSKKNISEPTDTIKFECEE